MTTWKNRKFGQILRWGLCVVFGSFISILTDFFISFFSPIGWFFFYQRFIGVALGSFVSGLIAKKRGGFIGVIISIVHIIYLVSILSYPHPDLTEETIKIDWLSLLPTGIFLLATGLIGGYIGEKRSEIMRRIHRRE